MTDERFEQFIRDAARDYNRPPEITPREEMWARIQDAQRTGGVASAGPVLLVERGGSGKLHRSFAPRTQWLTMAAAAGILLAAGIGIGRLTSTKSTPGVASDAPASQRPSGLEPLAAGEAPVTTAAQLGGESVSVAGGELRVRGQQQKPGAGQPRGTRSATRRTPLDLEANRMNATYQLASLRHLAEAEAMLTTFRSDSADRSMDPVVAKWSRELLSNTRLLLDTPAARDPLRRHLFEDLELVLTQIVQLSNTPQSSERDLIESTIREGHVMTRLRTAIPAGQPKGS